MSDQEQALQRLLARLTEHQQLEHLLREQQRLLLTLLSNLPGMAYRCRNSTDWRMEFVSEGCLALTGYAVTDLLDSQHMAYAELIHPADRDRVREQIQQALYRREPFRLSYRIITAAGEERWVLEQGRGVFDARGAVQALEGFITDITDRKQTEELLQLSEARYQAIIESQTDLLCRFLFNGMLTFVNDAYCRYFDRPRDAILATDFLLIVPELDRDTVRACIAQCDAGHPLSTYVHQVMRSDEQWRWMQWTVQAILGENDSLLELQAVGRDITEQRYAEATLRESEERYRRIVETAQEGIWQIDAEGRTTFANARMAEMLGCSLDALQGRLLFDFMDEEGRRIAEANLERRRQGITEQHDFKFRRLDGGEIWTLLSTNPILDAEGRYAGALAMIIDISDRKRMEETLRQLATHDALTGLFNRRYFFTLAERELERSQRYGHPLALLMLDLDHFKAINDSRGHQAGDQVLRAVASIIQTNLRQIDVVGRYGGEEFVVLLPETARMTALAVAKRLCAAVAVQSVELSGESLPITISVGMAVGFGDAALNLEEMLERADRALYAAKATGRNRVAVWPLVDAG